MTIHRITIKTITLPQGAVVDIKYWADTNKVYVAGFDETGKQVTPATYQAEVDIADDFAPAFKKSLIDGLAATVESDLLNNPNMHFKP